MDEQPTYTIMLRWSEEEAAYIGQLPDLPAIEGTGSTYEEALASVLEALRWWKDQGGQLPGSFPAQAQ